jgi:glycosyltransferase involved in cell wall biosynthesis
MAVGPKTLLSVVLPNFNHARSFPRALDALTSQDLEPDEILVFDDASSDDSLAVISHLAASRPSVRVLENSRNMGVVWCLQQGLELARGDYIYFAAADDWILPGFFSLGVGMLERHPQCGLFCGDAVLMDAHTGKFRGFRPAARPRFSAGPMSAQAARRLLRKADNWILTGSTIFRRAAVLAAGGFEPRLGPLADSYIARKVALTRGFCYAPQVVASWCVNMTGFSRTSALNPQRALAMLEVAPERIAADPTFPAWYPALFGRRWRFAVARLALESNPVERDLVVSLAGVSALDRAVLPRVLSLRPSALARLASLTWLWMRLRPYSLPRLVATAAGRRLEQIQSGRGGYVGYAECQRLEQLS